MERVEEITAAIEALPLQEYRRLFEWLIARDNTVWDEQLDRDNASGRLDWLFAEAKDEGKCGLLREWPASE